MGLSDRFGLPLSTGSSEAAARYIAAVDLLLSANLGAEEQLALLEELAPHWDDDWWFLGYLGWAYIETGEVAKGTRLVERSLAGNPRNAHAAHQRVHGFFEAGDATGGAAFIRDWLQGYE